ncbi:MAG: MerR family transcriptional regulator [Acidobacteria bacterium]|nr:MerR family transcriptional regulator [Acidobacteriota bacterium]MBI3263670.1 MerR family transcriptional regulator [Acidobacteriota bacterium]
MNGLPAEIPNRPLFKASEVCEVANVQPYVLRSWEQEFPDLGHDRPGGGSRLYRRDDLMRVLRIRQLVFDEGLTLAGARRRILEETGELDGDGELPIATGASDTGVPHTRELCARLAQVRTGLRSVLELLDRSRPAGTLTSQPAHPSGRQNGRKGRTSPKKRIAKRRALARRRTSR